ncbi:MAG: FtsQ-type POTRA domain-containing protein [Acidobacteria bacterium]|nr:FtsQ-type POTRA domain-containing protein [Acidobacteriota bacterium]
MAVDPEVGGQHLRRQKKRDIKRNREGRPLWKRLLIGSVRLTAALLLVGSAIALSMFVLRSEIFSLAEVQMLGAQHVNTAEIRHALEKEFPRNLFRIRLEKVRQLVEGQPWVFSCQVRRVFPNKLKILVVERRPVGLAKIESELFLVDRFGVVLQSYGSGFEHLDLPVIRGLENSTQENVASTNQARMETVMRVILELDSGPERLSDKVSEIDVSDPNRVALVPLEQPIRVLLGDSDFRIRYLTYLAKLPLMADLAAKYGAMDSVDLSVEHRIIFHTKNGSDSGIHVETDQTG